MSSSTMTSNKIPQATAAVRPAGQAWQRMIWKEVRQNLPMLSIFVLIMSITLALSKYFVQSQPSHPSFGNAFWLGFIWTFTNIFALAVGVFIFAPEKENRTDQFLRILPVSSGFAVRIKLAVGLATILCFALIGGGYLWIEVYGLGSKFVPLEVNQQNMSRSMAIALMILTGTTVTLECFFWGAICSLLAKRAIVAAIFATACFFVFSWLLPTLCGMAAASIPSLTPVVVAFLVSKVLIYVGMAIALVVFGKQWLGQPDARLLLPRFHVRRPGSPGNFSHAAALAGRGSESSRRSTRIYAALIWQSFRQFSHSLLMAAAIGVPLFALALVFAAFVDNVDWAFALFSAIVALTLIPLLSSMFVFSGDHQDRNYRFFQQHAEYGRRLWFARILPAGLVTLTSVLLLATTIYLTVAFVLNSKSSDGGMISSSSWMIAYRGGFAATLFVFAGFAIGQFNSMFFRSGVFTFACSMIMILIASAWIACLSFLGVNPWLYFAPIPAALMVITWWRAPGWLADRNRVRDIAPYWMALGLVSASVFAAMAYHRINEVPEISTSLRQQKFIDDQIQISREKKADHSVGGPNRLFWDAADAGVDYRSLIHPASHTDVGPVHLLNEPTQSNESALREFIDANSQAYDYLEQVGDLASITQYLDADSISHRFEQVQKLKLLIAAKARIAELEGDLPLALEYWLRYLDFETTHFGQSGNPAAGAMLIRWGEQTGQSTELIQRAIRALRFDSGSWRQLAERKSFYAQLDFSNWYEFQMNGSDNASFSQMATYQYNQAFRTPWEMERSRRIAQNSIGQLPNRYLVFDHLALRPVERFSPDWGAPLSQALQEASMTAPDEQTRAELFFRYGGWMEVFEMLKQIQSRRYAQVRLALSAWKLDHGQYPHELADLVPQYLDQLPADVFYGGSFAYSSVGKDERVGWMIRPNRQPGTIQPAESQIAPNQYETLVPANTPFLLPWTAYAPGNPVKCKVENNPKIAPLLVYDMTDPHQLIGVWLQDLAWSYCLKKSSSDRPGE